MKVTADTNLLCRFILGDDASQRERVVHAFAAAELIVIVAPSLCELFWVLRTRYGLAMDDIRHAMNKLLSLPRVKMDRPAVGAGLDLLEAGGDFADGLIAFEGRRHEGVVFLTFDRRAIHKLRQLGFLAQMP